MAKFSKQLILILLWACTIYAYNIDDFGAKPDDASYKTAKANGKAFLDAVLAANLSTTDKSVIVSRGKNYTMLPYAIINDIYNVTIEISGIINAWSENIVDWPLDERNNAISLISFRNTIGVTIRGNGLVEGNGLSWWWLVWITGVDNRPNLLDMEICKDTLIEGLTFQNAPEYHLNLRGALNMTVRHLQILVNDSAVASLPTFPLNTDGIDISGRDVVMYNLTIENYDDAVAVKPIHENQYPYSNCTENILIDNCRVKLGVGMSIGSVPPNPNVNCVRNITIRNVRFDEPFKAIYIKPNPGDNGMGLIEGITYENIEIYEALWWAIFIGTQQQNQPHGGADTGCSFLYPLPGQKCMANPHVTVRDITLRNVTIHGGLLSPGIFLCNESNPCTNLVFDGLNVYNRSFWPVPEGFLCINFHGHAVNSNLVPDCLMNSTMTQLSDSEIVDLQNSASRRHFKKRKGKGIFNHHN